MKAIIKSLALLVIYFSPCLCQNQGRINPFSNIGKNSLECFSGINLVFHGSGIVSTYVLIKSGADFKVHNFFAKNGYSPFFDPAVGIGYVMPVILGGGLYLFGETQNLYKEKAAGSAVIQAGLISLLCSSFLKSLTGRPNPDDGIYIDGGKASEKFKFGFMRGGIHYGWPSGHLCTNTAIVSSLVSFYNENTTLKIAGLLYLGYIFYGVTAHDNNRMHWFSDIISGLLMGYAIGSTTGKNFREKWNKSEEPVPDKIVMIAPGYFQFTVEENNNLYSISPLITPGYQGINLSISFK